MRDFFARWGVCILLFLATTLNYLDRQTMGILAPIIQREMRLDNAALGWLFSVFYYSYTFSQFGIGLLLDRYNVRWTYGLGVLAWSAVCAFTGMASGFQALIAFRLLLGITESVNWPAALRIVSRVLPPRDRPLGNGIFTSGTSIGALVAPGLILGVSALFGWRWAFVAVGSLGAVWFLIWIASTGSKELAPVWTGSAGKSGGSGYREILTSGQFWRVFAVTILVNPCLYFNLNWLPTYFVQERGIEAGRQLGWILTTIYIGLDLGYWLGGASARWLGRRIVFLFASALLALSAAVPFISGLRDAVAALVIVNFAIGMWIPIYLTMAQEVSSTHVSTAAGLLGGSGSLAGALAMWAVGRVTQQTPGFAIPLAGVAAAGILAAGAGLAVTAGARTRRA